MDRGAGPQELSIVKRGGGAGSRMCFFQAEDGIRDIGVTGVQTCALPISEGILSPRESNFEMIEAIENPDPETVIFRLKFPMTAFLPALSDPFAWIYKKDILEKDPRWYEKNILGSGPFKFAGYETGQSIRGVRNPDYYHPGKPYLDGFVAIY